MSASNAKDEFKRRLEEDRKRIKELQAERAREAAEKEAQARAEAAKKAQEAMEMMQKQAEEAEKAKRIAERDSLPPVYVVQAGDTLSAIALKYYGNAALWTEIYKANKKVIGDDPSKIFVGQELRIPKL